MDSRRTTALKLMAVCLICIGVVAGIVLLVDGLL